jgi:hypothetical protein
MEDNTHFRLDLHLCLHCASISIGWIAFSYMFRLPPNLEASDEPTIEDGGPKANP